MKHVDASHFSGLLQLFRDSHAFLANPNELLVQRERTLSHDRLVGATAHRVDHPKPLDGQLLLGLLGLMAHNGSIQSELPAGNESLSDEHPVLTGRAFIADLLTLVADDGIWAKADLHMLPLQCCDTSARLSYCRIVG